MAKPGRVSGQGTEISDALQLDRRTWRPVESVDVSRLEVVTRVLHWMPYPLAPDVISLDLAAAHLESGDKERAGELLRLSGARAALVRLAASLLGSGQLGGVGDRETYLRSRTLSNLVWDDVSGLADLAGRDDSRLRALAGELRLDRALVKRASAGGLSPLLSTEVSRRTSGNLLNLDADIPEVLAGRIDLAIVPPRVFVWNGPSYPEIRGARSGDKIKVRVTVGDLDPEHAAFFAFVAAGSGGVAEAQLRRESKGPGMVATLRVDFPGPYALGVRASDVSLAHAVERLLANQAHATRYLVEAWARLRLGVAALGVERAGGLDPVRGWVEQQPRALVELAQQVIAAPLAIAASPSLRAQLRTRADELREETARYARGDSWDGRSLDSGPARALVSEVVHVLDRRPGIPVEAVRE